MGRVLIGVAVAVLTALIGVSFTMMLPASLHEPSEHPADVPAAKSAAELARPDFWEVFHDFDLVGSCSASEATAGVCTSPHGLKESLPKPEAFEAGRIYAFHYRDSTDTDLLFEALENRLRSFGLDTEVSGSFSGMRLHPYLILFHGQGYAGRVVLSSHRTVSKGGLETFSTSVYDFTLTFARWPQ